MRLGQHHLNIILFTLRIALLSRPFDEALGFLFVLDSHLTLQVDYAQVVQRFYVFRVRRLLEVVQTFRLVFVLRVVVVKRCQVVQRSREVLLYGTLVVLQSLLGVGSNDLPSIFFQPILIQIT